MARVNRRLSGQQLRKCRLDSSAAKRLGQYYIVTLGDQPSVERTHVNLDRFARELGALAKFERVG